MTVEPGQRAVVAVAVATLWRRPEAARPADRPALGRPPDVAGWMRGLSREPRLHDGVLTQLLLGERVLVEEVRDGWARGVALDQPADRLDPRGYPGWLPERQLIPARAPEAPTVPGPEASTVDPIGYLVEAPATDLRDAPGGEVAVADVAMGTRLAAAGSVRDGWLPVRVPGEPGPLWVDPRDLAPVPAGPESPARALSVARRLLDSPYVWGGVTAHGIDCSGLVHLAWRRYGVTLPRDADDQFRATVPVRLGEERPGDLYFFAREGRPVHHVGFVAAAPTGSGEGERTMVHACYTQRRVVAEPVTGERHRTLVAAHRVAITL